MLEFNCRFGDPETQAVLPRLRSDLVELLKASAAPGGLAGVEPEWSGDWAVTVVLAAGGYPADYAKGDEITGLDGLDAEVFHAGTAESSGSVVTAGGRVLNVTGLGPTAAAARERAYEAAGADRLRRQADAQRHRRASGRGSGGRCASEERRRR